MNNKDLTRYLFYYKHTVCPTIDIVDDIANIIEYYNEYCNIDFNAWLVENDLFEEYMEYSKGI